MKMREGRRHTKQKLLTSFISSQIPEKGTILLRLVKASVHHSCVLPANLRAPKVSVLHTLETS